MAWRTQLQPGGWGGGSYLLFDPSSSCDEHVFLERGRDGIGVNQQPPGGSDYPLVGVPSSDIQYLLADFWLSFEDQTPGFSAGPPTYPLRIAYLHGLGCVVSSHPGGDVPLPTHAADVVVVDANNAIVFDSTQADTYNVYNWSDRLAVHEWIAGFGVCRLVAHAAWPDRGTPAAVYYKDHITPTNAILDGRTHYMLPKRVRQLNAILTAITQNAIELGGGYNIELTTATRVEGARRITSITVSAVPGAGLGRYKDCTTEIPSLRTINRVSPDASGNISIQAKDCYAIRIPSLLLSENPRRVQFIPHSLELDNVCGPCTDCDEFALAGEYLNALIRRYSDALTKTQTTRDSYRDLQARWQEAQLCFARKPLRVTLTPQICPDIDVVAQFCNQQNACVGPVRVSVDLSGTPVIGTPVGYYTWRSGDDPTPEHPNGRTARYSLLGSWPVFYADWDEVGPYSSVAVRFRLRFSDCGMYSGSPLEVSASVSATVDGSALEVPLLVGDGTEPASGTATATLRCPLSADDVSDYDHEAC